ncbi:MAG: iron-containing alcohol dehydrogenase [Propionibacteriaceae bacterium]|jgi:alcohol dehydrogenase class IV|nr:iron-containing alcohol dehydrogenase [Propionibacteriaceae bacterium]
MESFVFATSARIEFGAGRVAQLPQLVAGLGARPLVVTGGRPQRLAAVTGSLTDSAVFAVAQEPTFDIARAGLAAALSHGADVVVGLGGGSVLDTAKIIAALASNGGDPLDYAEVIGAGQPLSRPALPVVAVPTTSGTGSEVTANGVLAAPEHSVKVSLRSTTMLPRVALVDPALTLDLPPAVTAHSGLDALVQCVEPFVTPFANPLTDGFARTGIARSGRSLRRAYADGSDLAARTDLALASLLSGLCLANAKLGAAHGIAAPAGGLLGAPHGAITAAVMPAVCRHNLAAARAGQAPRAVEERYAEVGYLLTGRRTPEAGIEWFAQTAALLGVEGLASYGLTEAQIPALAEASARSSSSKGNPVSLTPSDFEAILTESL